MPESWIILSNYRDGSVFRRWVVVVDCVAKIQDSKIDLSYDIRVISRLLGDDNGKDVLIDFGNHFILVMEKLKASITNFSLE